MLSHSRAELTRFISVSDVGISKKVEKKTIIKMHATIPSWVENPLEILTCCMNETTNTMTILHSLSESESKSRHSYKIITHLPPQEIESNFVLVIANQMSMKKKEAIFQ